MTQDPILQSLAQIEAKLDKSLQNQDDMQAELAQIRSDCAEIGRKNGAVAGAVSGAVSGSIVATGIALIKAKFGL